MALAMMVRPNNLPTRIDPTYVARHLAATYRALCAYSWLSPPIDHSLIERNDVAMTHETAQQPSADHRTGHPAGFRAARTIDVGDELGQAAALVVGLIGVLAVIVLAIGMFGIRVSDLARARTAADAAALAGAAEGQRAASRTASANGAHLDSFTMIGSDVLVRVSIGEASATARAAIDSAGLPTLAGNGSDRRSG